MSAIVTSLILYTLVACVFTAPVSKDNIDDITNALKTQIKDQEQALASLGSLKDQVDSTKSLGISNSKSFAYSNINGAVEREEAQENKVTNPEEHSVISDITEHVKQAQKSPKVEPETSFQASVDIPAEGIHREISNDADADSMSSFDMPSEDLKDTIEFTPEVVAQYLYDHEAKADFLNLLNELVETSEITSEEAEQYEKSVMDELYKMEQASKRSDSDVNLQMVDQLYPQGFVDDQQPMYPVYNDGQTRDDMYPMYGGYGQVPMQEEEQDEVDNYINYVLNKPVTLEDMINNLLDQWLTKAIVTGDPEAEEILTNIVDYVSRDNNPNDEEQVKAVLGDIFAEALLEDLTPRLQQEDLKELNILPPSRPEVMEPLPVEQQEASDPELALEQAEQSNEQAMPEQQSESASNDIESNEEMAKMK